MNKDNYDLALSCASSAATDAFIEGIDQALRLDQPGISELQQAVALDGEFALAHAALGRQLQIHGYGPEAQPHFSQSKKQAVKSSKREQSAVDVIVATANFDPDALAKATNHVAKYPNDVFVLSHLLGPFGLLAFSDQHDWQQQNVQLLQTVESAYRADDWWFLATRAFMSAEIGDLDQASKDAEQAWQIQETGNCAHSLAHLHFEQGDASQGLSFIDNWQSRYGAESDMCHHLVWHRALLLLKQGGASAGNSTNDSIELSQQLLQMYALELDPRISDPMPLATFSDNAALLWRMHLSQINVPGEHAQDTIDYANLHYPQAGFAFADLHRVMAYAVLGQEELQQSLVRELADVAATIGTPSAKALVPIAEGFFALSNNQPTLCVSKLEPILQDAVLLGGSNPQRDVVAQTYFRAKMEAG